MLANAGNLSTRSAALPRGSGSGPIPANLDGEPGAMVFLSDNGSPRSSTGWRPGMIAYDAPVAEYW